jgi:hypothetical protein
MSSDFFKMPDKILGISSSLIKLFLLPVGVVLLFLLSLRLVIIPRINLIKSTQTSIKQVESEIDLTNEKREYLEAIDQDKLLKDESYLSSAVLQAKNSYLLVGVLRNIADRFDYRVRSFSINPISLKDEEVRSLKVSDQNVATKLPVKVILEGPEKDMINLLISVENSLPIMFIDSISILSHLSISNIELTVSSYYIADNSNLVSGNLTLVDLKPTAEETELLSRISQFDRDDNLIKSLSEQGTEGKVFVDYNRDDPFNL